MQLVKISEIKIRNRKRKLGDIEGLIQSIKLSGLINPITISTDYVLIAGLHRLEACKKIGHTEINANILDAGESETELLEIDENLVRNNLTVLEQAEQLKRRKEIYEELYPESNPDIIKLKNLSKRNDCVSEKPKTFTKDTAMKTGKSQRSIQQDLQIANKISEEIKEDIKGTELENNKTSLLKIAKEPVENQGECLRQIQRGESNLSNTKKELDIAYKVDFVLKKVVVDGHWIDLPRNYNMEEASYSKMHWEANAHNKNLGTNISPTTKENGFTELGRMFKPP